MFIYFVYLKDFRRFLSRDIGVVYGIVKYKVYIFSEYCFRICVIKENGLVNYVSIFYFKRY